MPINYQYIAAKHGGTTVQVRRVDYADLAKKFNGYSLPHESQQSIFPPELERLSDAIGVRIVDGKPTQGYNGDSAIAGVATHEPHEIIIHDKQRFDQAPIQNIGHETIHLLHNNLPGKMQSATLPDNPNTPYDISDIDYLRKQGHTIATIPEEKAARIVQTWIAAPAERKRLQSWIDDLGRTPLSVMEQTSPADKTINMHPRPPLVPLEAYK